ncbi:MAG: hypothetical protein ACI8RW_000199 [Porticoccaceae bacterium]
MKTKTPQQHCINIPLECKPTLKAAVTETSHSNKSNQSVILRFNKKQEAARKTKYNISCYKLDSYIWS